MVRSPRRPMPVVALTLWCVGAALFALVAMNILVPFGPIRTTATQLPGIISAWYLGRRYAWLPTVSSMAVVPFISVHVTSGPIPFMSFLIQLGLAVSLVTAVGALRDNRDALVTENQQRREAEAELQSLNAHLECRVEAALKELRSANEELDARVQERTRELQSAVDDLEWLIAVIAHDVRAPLRHIRSYADLIAEAKVLDERPDEKHALERVQARGRDLSDMIESLLKVGRSRFRDLGHGPVDLRGLLQKLLEDRDPTTYTLGSLPECHGDEVVLREIFGNLIENAYRHGSPPVHIFGDRVGAAMRLSVEDSGAGSDFRPGLGLMIVRRLAARIGADFTIGRTPDGKTVATLECRPSP